MFIFNKEKKLDFKRTYNAPVEKVWQSWTNPDILKQWWGPEKTFVKECEIDLRVGGRIYIVMEAGEEMGKYKGIQWPTDGKFTLIEEKTKLVYEAQSWTEGEKEKSLIDLTAELNFTEDNGKTNMDLVVTIHKTGISAQLAAMGMKFGYNQQFDKLAKYLEKAK